MVRSTLRGRIVLLHLFLFPCFPSSFVLIPWPADVLIPEMPDSSDLGWLSAVVLSGSPLFPMLILPASNPAFACVLLAFASNSLLVAVTLYFAYFSCLFLPRCTFLVSALANLTALFACLGFIFFFYPRVDCFTSTSIVLISYFPSIL